MSIEALRARLPEYARDLRLNLGTLAAEPGLTKQQLAGCFVASALASRMLFNIICMNIASTCWATACMDCGEFGSVLSAASPLTSV